MSEDGDFIYEPPRIGPYVFRGTVGEGAFSIVKLVYHEETHSYYACKIVPKSRIATPSLQARFELEIRINQQLNHPGVAHLFDFFKDEHNFYVIMEFCPNGELLQYIVDHQRLEEDEAKLFVRQILETIQYIHENNITHRDMKPENLLIDAKGNIKLTDFGLSRYIPANNLVDTPCGSPCYASPECISGRPYNGLTTDVWSTGVIVYAMVTGQLPWTKRNQAQLFAQIRKGEYKIPDFVSSNCADFIRGLLTVDPASRLTVEQAFYHPFLACVGKQFNSTEFYSDVPLKRIDQFFGREISEIDLTNIDLDKKESAPLFKIQVLTKICSSNQKALSNHYKAKHEFPVAELPSKLPPAKIGKGFAERQITNPNVNRLKTATGSRLRTTNVTGGVLYRQMPKNILARKNGYQ